MDFKRLLYFCTIVEQGQISRAAKVLNITQPPLSLKLKELEDSVGTPLILRTGDRWEVTPIGQRLYTRGRQILHQLDTLNDELTVSPKKMAGEVKIAVSYAFRALFSLRYRLFFERYPDIRHHILFADHSSIEEKLQNYSVDLAMIMLPLKYTNYVSKTIGNNRYDAFFPACITPPPGKDISLENLCKYPLLLPKRKGGTAYRYEALMTGFRSKNLVPKVQCVTASIAFLVDLLHTNVPAVAVIPETSFINDGHPPLESRRILAPGLDFQLAVVHREDTLLSPILQATKDMLIEYCASKEHTDGLITKN